MVPLMPECSALIMKKCLPLSLCILVNLSLLVSTLDHKRVCNTEENGESCNRRNDESDSQSTEIDGEYERLQPTHHSIRNKENDCESRSSNKGSHASGYHAG